MAVLTITPIAAARGADYLINSVGRQDGVAVVDEAGVAAYFDAAVRQGEPGGIWFGRQAEADGLAGQEVTREQLGRLFRRGEHPETGRQLGRRPAKYQSVEERVLAMRERGAEQGWSDERLHREEVAIKARGEQVARTGYDLTFTCPKSASVLFAIASDEAMRKLVLDAHESAVLEAMNRLDAMILTRTGTDGIRQEETQGIFAAGFTHRTSRADDPHLHTHVAVAAKVQTADGKWLALDGQQLFNVSAIIRNHYELRLMANLSRDLGVRWVRREKTGVMEIKGASEELLEGFSKRSPGIERYMQRNAGATKSRFGIDHYRAWAATWRRKSAGETTAVLGGRWRREADAYQRRALEAMNERSEDLSIGLPPATWDRLVEAAERSGSIVPLASLGVRLPSRADVAAISEALVAAVPAWRLQATVALLEQERSTWTPAQVASVAKRLFEAHPQLVRSVGDRVVELDIEAELAGTTAAVLEHSRRLTPEEPTKGWGPVRSDGRSVYERTESVRYTSPRLLAEEAAILQLAETPGAITYSRRQIQAGLRAFRRSRPDLPELSPGQLVALSKVLATDTRLRVLVGPAGAGKTTTMAALVAICGAEGRRVVGLCTSQIAANVLAEETGMQTANVAAFLDPRSARGAAIREAISRGDLVVFDEASMISTLQGWAGVAKVVGAGADSLFVGDPFQLGAVGPSGLFAELCRRHDAAELTEIQRFRDPETSEIRQWEADASMALRRGDVVAALAAYDAHGSIVGATEDELRRRAVEKVLAGRTEQTPRHVLVVVSTEAQAAELSAAVRLRLVEAGQVDDEHTVVLADGNRAGKGDLIQTRKNHNQIQVHNRDVWTIDQVTHNGSVWGVHADGRRRLLGPDIVIREVQLSYAVTAHAAQGTTVDESFAIVTAETSRAALYVSVTRHRIKTTIGVATDTDGYRPTAERDPLSLLAELIERGDLNRSAAATVEALHGQQYGSLKYLGAVAENLRVPTATSIDVAAVVAERDPEASATLATDPGLTRLERSLDQLSTNGWDAEAALRSVAAERSFARAESVADVLEWRLDARFGELGRLDEELGMPRPLIAGSGPEWLQHVYGPPSDDPGVQATRAAMERRIAVAVAQAREDDAEWLGAIPAHSEGPRRNAVAAVAAYRDLSGYDGPDPIGPPPPLYDRAERAAWRVARDTMAAAEVPLPSSDTLLLERARRTERALTHEPSDEARRAATRSVPERGVRSSAADAAGADPATVRAEAYHRAVADMGNERRDAASQELDRLHGHSSPDRSDDFDRLLEPELAREL